MTDPLLYRLRGVHKGYGDRFLLRVDELDVAEGDVLCLVGPVGAGKSTLLRLLAGLTAVDQGEIRLGSHVFNGRLPPVAVQRRVTLVFQRPLLLDDTVRGNVEYGLRLRGQYRRGQVDDLLDHLGLAELAGRSARTLSGGQAQLVAVARALSLEPQVLLLDEPTAHLDPATVERVEQAVADANRRQATVVWATHNLFQARRVARRAALLLEGTLVEAGPSPEFFESPTDDRTAAFVAGRMVY